ncbi:hypothetical protein H4582DRAFT_2010177 [Lactarius indigo]|nr:hypothetical protein H4582DRAFT_2010177 [Lactarius indigo]
MAFTHARTTMIVSCDRHSGLRLMATRLSQRRIALPPQHPAQQLATLLQPNPRPSTYHIALEFTSDPSASASLVPLPVASALRDMSGSRSCYSHRPCLTRGLSTRVGGTSPENGPPRSWLRFPIGLATSPRSRDDGGDGFPRSFAPTPVLAMPRGGCRDAACIALALV